VLMELQEYPFSKRFGWLQDRFEISWQLSLARLDPPRALNGAQRSAGPETPEHHYPTEALGDIMVAAPRGGPRRHHGR
jgi:predicted 3-demethylubiquinone-9 3-methyltransferase (glyoxalase superfamily)